MHLFFISLNRWEKCHVRLLIFLISFFTHYHFMLFFTAALKEENLDLRRRVNQKVWYIFVFVDKMPLFWTSSSVSLWFPPLSFFLSSFPLFYSFSLFLSCISFFFFLPYWIWLITTTYIITSFHSPRALSPLPPLPSPQPSSFSSHSSPFNLSRPSFSLKNSEVGGAAEDLMLMTRENQVQLDIIVHAWHCKLKIMYNSYPSPSQME